MRTQFDFESNSWKEGFAPPPAINPAELPAPREGVWTVKVEPKRTSRYYATVLFVSAVAIAAAIFTIGVDNPAPFLLIVVVTSLLLLGRALNDAADGPVNLTIEERDWTLLENPEDADFCLVAICVRKGGRSLGTDRGVAWFSNSQLLFSGHRTSFAIGGQNIFTPNQSSLSPEMPDSYIPLRHPAGAIVLDISPLQTPISRDGIRQAAEMRFLKRLYDFRRTAPVSKEQGQWPPVDL